MSGPRERDALNRGESIGGDIVDPGVGAHFVARLSGGVQLRVHDGIPGERVRVRRDPGDPAWGRIEAWDRPSHDRRPPPCPLAAACGGCHWLSIDEARQRAIRRERLIALCALHGVTLQGADEAQQIIEIPSPHPTAYRYRARLQIDGAAWPPRVGFHGDRDWAIVDAAVCAMFAAPLARVYDAVRNLIRSAAREDVADLTGAEIVALPGAPGGLVYLNPRDRAPAAWPRLAQRWLSERGDTLAGVSVRLPGGDPRVDLVGARAIVGQAPAGMPVAVAARGFLQANLGCAELLARTLADRVIDRAAASAPPRVLELYAGSGLFGWAMADRGADVVGVELDADAVAASRLLPAPSRGRFSCRRGDSRRVPLDDRDLLLTDAPRAGLGALADSIVKHGPASVVVISCYAEAMARDLGALTRGGYRVAQVLLADFYPQTQHTEAAVILARTG